MERSKGRYLLASKRVLSTSKLFQRGKTHVPIEVRNLLGFDDGDTIVWILEDGKIFIKSATNSI